MQVVLLEMERRAAVEGLRGSVAAERAKVEAYKRDLAALDESIESARSAMKRFRGEFEALRVSLLVDRMSKSSTVAGLAERRRKLAAEQEAFAEAVEAAKARAAAEEAGKWEAM
jgi:peptidoglycan hydrolase CwlO-like protein